MIDSQDFIQCPHCGQMHPQGTDYCPETGLPLFYEAPPAKVQPWTTRVTNRKFLTAVMGIFILLAIASVIALISLLRPPEAKTNGPDFSVLTVEAGQVSLTQIAAGLAGLAPLAETETPAPVDTQLPAGSGPVSEPWQACTPGDYLSRLHVGDTVKVSEDPPLPNRVRDSAGTEGEVLGHLQPGEQALILEGPGCANQWVWWRVRSTQTGLEGWTAEGDLDGYWLIPVAP